MLFIILLYIYFVLNMKRGVDSPSFVIVPVLFYFAFILIFVFFRI